MRRERHRSRGDREGPHQVAADLRGVEHKVVGRDAGDRGDRRAVQEQCRLRRIAEVRHPQRMDVMVMPECLLDVLPRQPLADGRLDVGGGLGDLHLQDLVVVTGRDLQLGLDAGKRGQQFGGGRRDDFDDGAHQVPIAIQLTFLPKAVAAAGVGSVPPVFCQVLMMIEPATGVPAWSPSWAVTMNGLSVGSDSSEATTETTVESPVTIVSAAVTVVSWPRAIFSGTPACDSTPPGSMSSTPPFLTNSRVAPCSMPTLTFCELDCAVIAALLLTCCRVERAPARARVRERPQ